MTKIIEKVRPGAILVIERRKKPKTEAEKSRDFEKFRTYKTAQDRRKALRQLEHNSSKYEYIPLDYHPDDST